MVYCSLPYDNTYQGNKLWTFCGVAREILTKGNCEHGLVQACDTGHLFEEAYSKVYIKGH